MKHFFRDIDPKYKKIACLASATVIITVIILFLLNALSPWFGMVWKILTTVLKPLILGAVLSYLLSPLVSFFYQKLDKKFPQKKWTRTVSILIAIVLILAAVALILTILIWTAAKQITSIDLNAVENFFNNTQSSFGALMEDLEEYLESSSFDFSTITSWITKQAGNLLSHAAGTISTLFFGLIFAIYFLADGQNITSYWKKALRVLLPAKSLSVMKQLLLDADECFSGYIRGQVLDAILVGVVTTVVFLLCGMPYAVIIGLITGFGNLIPYVGPILGYASVVLVNLVNLNWQMMILGLILLIIIMFIDGNIINPRLLGSTVHVHPLLVIAALLAGGAIGGVLGMLLAVPVAAFLKKQFDRLIVHRKNIKAKTE
jgi:predicted PurR-regulated permease PerM